MTKGWGGERVPAEGEAGKDLLTQGSPGATHQPHPHASGHSGGASRGSPAQPSVVEPWCGTGDAIPVWASGLPSRKCQPPVFPKARGRHLEPLLELREVDLTQVGGRAGSTPGTPPTLFTGWREASASPLASVCRLGTRLIAGRQQPPPGLAAG